MIYGEVLLTSGCPVQAIEAPEQKEERRVKIPTGPRPHQKAYIPLNSDNSKEQSLPNLKSFKDKMIGSLKLKKNSTGRESLIKKLQEEN